MTASIWMSPMSNPFCLKLKTSRCTPLGSVATITKTSQAAPVESNR